MSRDQEKSFKNELTTRRAQTTCRGRKPDIPVGGSQPWLMEKICGRKLAQKGLTGSLTSLTDGTRCAEGEDTHPTETVIATNPHPEQESLED